MTGALDAKLLYVSVRGLLPLCIFVYKLISKLCFIFLTLHYIQLQ